MRELVLQRISKHWDDSLAEIFDIEYNDISTLSDNDLLDLYDRVFELGFDNSSSNKV